MRRLRYDREYRDRSNGQIVRIVPGAKLRDLRGEPGYLIDVQHPHWSVPGQMFQYSAWTEQLEALLDEEATR
jgi:hypothetical protein